MLNIAWQVTYFKSIKGLFQPDNLPTLQYERSFSKVTIHRPVALEQQNKDTVNHPLSAQACPCSEATASQLWCMSELLRDAMLIRVSLDCYTGPRLSRTESPQYLPTVNTVVIPKLWLLEQSHSLTVTLSLTWYCSSFRFSPPRSSSITQSLDSLVHWHTVHVRGLAWEGKLNRWIALILWFSFSQHLGQDINPVLIPVIVCEHGS